MTARAASGGPHGVKEPLKQPTGNQKNSERSLALMRALMTRKEIEDWAAAPGDAQ